MSLPPSGTILVNKVNGSNNFVEDILDVTDLVPLLQGQYVTLTGAQTVSGVKTFASAPVLTGLTASRVVLTNSGNTLASASFGSSEVVLTSGAQSIAGVKTLSSNPILSAAVFGFGSDTSDGSDSKRLLLIGGGYDSANPALRGGYLELFGNEAGGGTPGWATLAGGTVASSKTRVMHLGTGDIEITTLGAGPILLSTNSVERFRLTPTGDALLASINFYLTAATTIISKNTSDGSDNGRLLIQGGGADSTNSVGRGSWIDLYGNEAGGGNAGLLWLSAGNVAGGGVRLYSFGTQPTEIWVSNQRRWRIDNSGSEFREVLTTYGTSSYTTGTGHVRQAVVVNTTNATTTNIFNFALADNTAYKFTVEIVGRFNSTTARGISGQLRFGVYRNNAGSAVLVGTRIKEFDTWGSSEYDFDVVVAGNNVQIQVTGAVSSTVSWMGEIEYIGVSTST